MNYHTTQYTSEIQTMEKTLNANNLSEKNSIIKKRTPTNTGTNTRESIVCVNIKLVIDILFRIWCCNKEVNLSILSWVSRKVNETKVVEVKNKNSDDKTIEIFMEINLIGT